MNADRILLEWFEQHCDADEIVVATRTGLPVEARYIRLHGVPRIYPAVYRFPFTD